jgi:DNA uptake protein ComE-like DNA-binding protein
MSLKKIAVALSVVGLALVFSARVDGQVGKSLGVVDANLASEPDLLKMPHMTPAIVKGLIAARTANFFSSSVDLNKYLLGAGLTQAQAMEFYGSAFIHVNLNTGTREEILLIPNAGARMVREFGEYRPWKTLPSTEISRTSAGSDGQAEAVRFHPGGSEYRDGCRHPLDSRRRKSDGPGVQGIPAVESEAAVRQGNQQVRRPEGNRSPLALRRHPVTTVGRPNTTDRFAR